MGQVREEQEEGTALGNEAHVVQFIMEGAWEGVRADADAWCKCKSARGDM